MVLCGWTMCRFDVCIESNLCVVPPFIPPGLDSLGQATERPCRPAHSNGYFCWGISNSCIAGLGVLLDSWLSPLSGGTVQGAIGLFQAAIRPFLHGRLYSRVLRVPRNGIHTRGGFAARIAAF